MIYRDFSPVKESLYTIIGYNFADARWLLLILRDADTHIYYI